MLNVVESKIFKGTVLGLKYSVSFSLKRLVYGVCSLMEELNSLVYRVTLPELNLGILKIYHGVYHWSLIWFMEISLWSLQSLIVWFIRSNYARTKFRCVENLLL